MRRPYTQEQIAWLRANAPAMSVADLALAFNAQFSESRTFSAIRSTMKREGIRNGRPVGNPQGTLRTWTREQSEFVRAAYRKMPIDDVCTALNVKFGTTFSPFQVRSLTRNQGMKSGRTGQFCKGQRRVPGSGAKGPNRTSFKKGTMAGAAQHNYVPIGAERVSKDGYRERKVTDDPNLVPARRWVGVHRLVWEQENGPIPDGHVIVFLDGDKRNCAPSNLRCVPRGALAHLNQRWHPATNTRGAARTAAILAAELQHRAIERSKP